MNKMTLVVNVSAKFEWLEPPKDMEEQVLREQADIMAGSAARRLEQAVQMLVLALMESQIPIKAKG